MRVYAQLELQGNAVLQHDRNLLHVYFSCNVLLLLFLLPPSTPIQFFIMPACPSCISNTAKITNPPLFSISPDLLSSSTLSHHSFSFLSTLCCPLFHSMSPFSPALPCCPTRRRVRGADLQGLSSQLVPHFPSSLSASCPPPQLYCYLAHSLAQPQGYLRAHQ